VDILAAQTNRLTAAQTSPTKEQHKQPIPRRTTCLQQRARVLIADPVDSFVDDRNAMTGPHPQPPGPVLAARLRRKISTVRQLVELTEHMRRGITTIDSEGQKPSRPSKNAVDPPRPAHRRAGRGPGRRRRVPKHNTNDGNRSTADRQSCPVAAHQDKYRTTAPA
jgi:hypothetical protein